MTEEVSREEIEQIVNNNVETPVEEPIKEEPVEEIKEAVVKEIKPKAKRASRAKVKIVKESVEPVEPVIEKPVEPVIEEQPKKVDKLKQIVKCPDCGLDMTAHTLKYIHKRRGFCKADVKPEYVGVSRDPPDGRGIAPSSVVPETVPEQPKLTQDIVNDYIKQNPDVISNYLRNERAMKAQKKQMNARSLLNNAF